MTITAHDITIDDVSYKDKINPTTISMRDIEGQEVDTMDFEITDIDNSLDPQAWKEVIWEITDDVDGTYNLFGGYVVRIQKEYLPTGRKLVVRAEGFITRFHKATLENYTWQDSDARTIVLALLVMTGLNGVFDTTNVQNGGYTFDSFYVSDDELLPDALDRLAEYNNWVWRISSDKELIFGSEGVDVAPFNVGDATKCEEDPSLEPAEAGSMTAVINGIDVINKVRIFGGQYSSDEVTEEFTGDGSTTSWLLSYRNIIEIKVWVDDVVVPDGTEWWHTYSERTVLTDYKAGRISFSTPPANGADVDVAYNYWKNFYYEKEDTASQTAYGITFEKIHKDSSITTEAEAELAANSILEDEFVEGAFTVLRPGLRAGQTLQVYFPRLGYNGDTMVLRNLTYEVMQDGRTIKCSAKFSEQDETTLRDTILNLDPTQQNSAYQPSTSPGYYIAWEPGDEYATTRRGILPYDLGFARISINEPDDTFPGMIWVDTS